jgi:alkylhydroperoxidase/carboxymuconolactone decarboxylase family protein YurZ
MGVDVNYMERLRCLAINDARFAEGVGRDLESQELTPKALALVRLAALIAVGGAGPSYGAQADAAVSAGATAAEIVDVLVAVVPVVGLPRGVAAAPKLALALGYETDDALEPQSGG